MTQRVTIIKIRKGNTDNINQELQWLGNSLGLFNLRDKDSSCFRVFITIVKKSRFNESVSSDEIAEKLHLTRGTVVHHLTKLMESGIVAKEREGYILRERNLADVIKDLQHDVESMFSELRQIANDIDEKLG